MDANDTITNFCHIDQTVVISLYTCIAPSEINLLSAKNGH